MASDDNNIFDITFGGWDIYTILPFDKVSTNASVLYGIFAVILAVFVHFKKSRYFLALSTFGTYWLGARLTRGISRKGKLEVHSGRRGNWERGLARLARVLEVFGMFYMGYLIAQDFSLDRINNRQLAMLKGDSDPILNILNMVRSMFK